MCQNNMPTDLDRVGCRMMTPRRLAASRGSFLRSGSEVLTLRKRHPRGLVALTCGCFVEFQ
jgi:hypothetical protein